MAGDMMQPKLIKRLGWRRDSLDTRDHHFKPTVSVRRLPAVVDLRSHCVPRMDQGDLGSCVAHGVTGVVRFAMMKEGYPDKMLSRLQLYWDGRFVEGTVKEDSGLEVRDAIKCVASIGVAPEPLWPYNIDRFKQKPFPRVYQRAIQFLTLEYQRVEPNATSIKAAIASGFPVVGGFNVFKQYMDDQCARDGMVRNPASSEGPIGGHCIYWAAYGIHPGTITGCGSWSAKWGDKGDSHFPEEFLERQGSDFWAITKVSVGK